MRWTIVLLLVACSGSPDPDAGRDPDAGMPDAGPDSGCNILDRDEDGHESAFCGGDDCADDDPNRFPDNPEVCDDDAHDEDCNPDTYGERDGDDDTFNDGDCCNATELTYGCGPDCDDTSPNIHPGVAETCDLIDEDCNGMVDDGAMRLYYFDFDFDGHGNPADEMEACEQPEGYVESSDDCDDACGACWTGHAEECDGIDNDCDPFTGDVCP